MRRQAGMEGNCEQWRVGNKCMAPYSGDALYYRASIQSITTSSQGHHVASVRFSGFTEEEDEIIDVRHLKKRPARVHRDRSGTCTESASSTCCTTSAASSDVTSPLKYLAEEDRLRAKYADLFEDADISSSPSIKTHKPRDTSPSPLSSSSSASSSRFVSRTTNKRKTPVAIGGEVKATDDVTQPKRSPASAIYHVPPRMPIRQLSEKDSFDFLDEGFSCEEMEKPFFPGVSNASAKVPLVLSQPGVDTVIQVPATINRYLRDYQREGVKFLYQRYQKDEGAILGDDMGLGKTIQVLAFLCAVLRKTGTKEDCQRRLPEFMQKKMKTSSGRSSEVFLIICPNSVLYNWLDEFETWTYCTVGKYHGRERQETLWKAMKGKLDAVITSYETYRIYMDSLLKVKWAGVIVDEVHKIKEPGSQITQALKEVNTMRRYGLTGTALQNKLSELWCVIDWANPDCLGSLADFKVKFEDPISKGQKFHASKRELAESRRVLQEFAELRDRWMVRRTKALISHQLPTKEEKVVFCKLTELQLSIYKALLDSDDMQLVLKQKDICDCGSQLIRMHCCFKYNPEGEKVKSLTMTFMSLLIKVANHIALLTPDVHMSGKQRQKAQKYCDIAFARHPQFVALSREARFCTLSDPSYCGKMQILEKLLRVFKQEGSKVLLFSFYTQLLNIIEMYLKTTEYVYRRLDGKTPAQDRQKFVHEFNKDHDIFLFLISTKAGGLGLNLTGANVVIIFDPNWNPTYDLQAQDRAYRIGQHRDVRVYRLISTGSIEENMYLRQVYKQQLASAAVTSENPMRYFTAVAGDKKQQGELFGLHNMFELRADTSCLTKDLIQRHIKTEEGITMAKYISPSPTESDTEQASREDVTAVDDDSDSSHSNHDITMHNEDISDDHGVASQFLSDSDCDNNDNEDDSDDQQIPATKNSKPKMEREDHKSVYSSGKTTAQSCHSKNNDIAKSNTTHSRRNYGQTISESSSEEEITQRNARGKAILHRDGRTERRAKGLTGNQPDNSTMKRGVRGQTENIRRSEVTSIKTVGHRLGTDTNNSVKDKSKKSTKAVDDVFKECGVAFIHSNMKIVGGSRVEDHVSNIAMRDVYDLGLNSQQPANYNVPTLQESTPDSPVQEKESSQSDEPIHELLLAQSQQASHKMDGTTVLFGQTPRGIRRHHFEAMAKTLKHSSSSDFARYILSLPHEQYSQLLQDYYTTKHPQICLAKLYQPPKPPEEQIQDVQSQRKTKRRTKPLDVKKVSKKHNVRTGGRGVGKGCHFESFSEEDEIVNDRSRINRTKKDYIGKNRMRRETHQVVDASSSDTDDIDGRMIMSRLRTSRISHCLKDYRDNSKNGTKGESKQVDDSSNSDSEDDGKKIPSKSGDRQVSRRIPGKKGQGIGTDQKQSELKSSPTTEKSVNRRKSHQKGPSHMDASDDDRLVKDLNHSKCQTCQTHDSCDCDMEDRLSDSSAGMKKSSLASNVLHKEENLSFLDDIFLPENSKKPPKPPPKKKSPRVRQKTTVCIVKGDFSDSDIEMEDLSNIRSWSVKSENHLDREGVGGTLWRRNSKFTTRQTVLEQASIEAKLESRSVFEKYADSFVPNEHFLKRDLDKC